MSEEETQEQKPKKCDLANISLGLGIFSAIISPIMYPPCVFWPLVTIGLALGIVSLVRIKKSKGQLKGRRTATFGIVVNIILLIFFATTIPLPARKLAYRMRCGAYLKTLGTVMQVYASDNKGCYPSVNKWCDLLINNEYITEDNFVCNRAREYGNESRSHYAMNTNCGLKSSPDMVLLFETKGGWNQSGGAELLTAENHEGQGANILFNDCHVDFISVRDFNDLKWK